MIEQLILVRHGETLHNVAGIAQGWLDSELSDAGKAQVAALATRLAAMKPNALFSSSLRRAVTTAEAIAAATGLEIRELDDLREMNYGRWEGRSFLDVRREQADAYARWVGDENFACPEGESHADVLRRMECAFSTIEASSDGTRLRPIVVSHGTAIRVGATSLLGATMATSRHLAQDNAALNLFVHRGDRLVLKRWNDTSHYE